MNKVFLIDVSGGVQHTKDSLAVILFRNLYPDDMFEVIYFDHMTYPVYSELVLFNNENVHHAVRWHTKIIGGGGTMLSEPLEMARMLIAGDELGQVIIFSDGYWSI